MAGSRVEAGAGYGKREGSGGVQDDAQGSGVFFFFFNLLGVILANKGIWASGEQSYNTSSM